MGQEREFVGESQAQLKLAITHATDLTTILGHNQIVTPMITQSNQHWVVVTFVMTSKIIETTNINSHGGDHR
jgi:hypothetical protein